MGEAVSAGATQDLYEIHLNILYVIFEWEATTEGAMEIKKMFRCYNSQLRWRKYHGIMGNTESLTGEKVSAQKQKVKTVAVHGSTREKTRRDCDCCSEVS